MRSPLRSPARSPARSSIPLPKWRPRKTLIDLYNEKDRTQWYWKVSAVISAFMVMIGYGRGVKNVSNLKTHFVLGFWSFRQLLCRRRILPQIQPQRALWPASSLRLVTYFPRLSAFSAKAVSFGWTASSGMFLTSRLDNADLSSSTDLASHPASLASSTSSITSIFIPAQYLSGTLPLSPP